MKFKVTVKRPPPTLREMLNASARVYQDAYYEDWKNGRTGFQQIFLGGKTSALLEGKESPKIKLKTKPKK